MVTHTGDKQFICAVCDKPFGRRGNKQSCYYCGKESTFRWHSECHEKFSSGDTRPFSCHVCNKNLMTKEGLKYHINFHLQESQFRCDLCDKVTGSKSASLTHWKTHFPKEYQCDTCFKKYREKSTLDIHMKYHHSVGIFTDFICDICDKILFSKSSLKNHRKIHFPKDHHCNICFKIFRNQSTLDKHQISHQPGKTNKDILCDICGYLCERISLLKTHISNVHSHERKYICEVCGAGTNKINKWKTHFPKEYQCDTCFKKYREKSTLDIHMKYHHSVGIFTDFICDICDKILFSKSSLKNHRKIHFPKDHHCNICFKIFRNQSTLDKHQISHQPGKTNKDILCDICGYLCERISLLKTHISNVHSHERKYICEVCGAGTNKINKLKDHMVSHTGDKQFICAVCDKPFGRRGTLKRHIMRYHPKTMGGTLKKHIMRYHPKTMGLSRKTFSCSLCEKVYQSYNGIIKHMRSHTGERNFVCDLCGKHFMHAFDLSKHKKSSIHNEELAAQQKNKRIKQKLGF
uniref:C2H2-type domain-containing protein n=1 Tax=Timema monikensis TaxID=170555 RepID=A0A7R9DYK8_9NEOP|nr:unnamed protein product [Timema monikensis]